MVYLKLFRSNQPEHGHTEVMEFETAREALSFGNRSGLSWQVEDPESDRVFDAREIEVGEEEEWYYDASEQIWKRFPERVAHVRNISIALTMTDHFPAVRRNARICQQAC